MTLFYCPYCDEIYRSHNIYSKHMYRIHDTMSDKLSTYIKKSVFTSNSNVISNSKKRDYHGMFKKSNV